MQILKSYPSNIAKWMDWIMPHYEYLNRYQLINVYLNVNDMTNFNPLILQKNGKYFKNTEK